MNQVLLDIGHPSTLIIPLTTNLIEDAAPLRIRAKAMDKLEKDSDLLIDQMCAIDNIRFIQGPLAQCDTALMHEVHKAILNVINCNITRIKDN